ncbi:hypothetical protein CPB83DRAFT_847298 [Crepidotus variabilis]|uniref:Monopolin complex subunit Csm1/Pcs1 C-terminal domain-containing protein n=1 Tax=Crepidotus variabilis TaxID=179855 RepID=A0A9P6EP76_9AGAR|nr:hypothetical protein CPB83DRAFT_847298 [Crepidotus variabilis]
MSDSDNDFGGFSGTTPDTKKLPTRQGNPTAGPSRVPTTNGKRKLVHSDSDSDVQEVTVVKGAKRTGPPGKRKRKVAVPEEEDVLDSTSQHRLNGNQLEEESEDVQEIAAPPSKKPRAASKKPASHTTHKASEEASGTEKGTAPAPINIATNAKGRVKARTMAHVKLSSSKVASDGVVELSDDEFDDELQEDAVELAEAITQAHLSRSSAAKASRKDTEKTTRLEGRLKQAQDHIEDLKRQLQELHKIRVTEPEQLLERIEAQHESERQARERLIDDLEKQLQRKDPLLRTNKNAVFELLTREEADKEMQKLKDQTKTYQDAIHQRDQLSKQADEEIKSLQTKTNDLKTELQLEIERSKQLLAKSNQRPPDSAQRPLPGRTGASNDSPQIRELTKFYEDLTNMVVLNVKAQKSNHFDLDDWMLSCMYTYSDVVNLNAIPKALNFSLRLCQDPISGLEGEPKSVDDLVDSVHFKPLQLENESQEFVDSLGFLNTPFTFERSQLSLFLRTLHDVLSGEGNKEQPDSDVEVIA